MMHLLAPILRLCSGIVSAWLVYAALAKLEDANSFSSIMLAHAVFPLDLARPLSRVVPWAELILGALGIFAVLSSRPYARVVMALQAALFMSFAVYAGVLWHHPPAIPLPCGCGMSRSVVQNWSLPLIRACALTVVTMAAAVIGLWNAPVGRTFSIGNSE